MKADGTTIATLVIVGVALSTAIYISVSRTVTHRRAVLRGEIAPPPLPQDRRKPRENQGLTKQQLDELFPAKPYYVALKEIMEMGTVYQHVNQDGDNKPITEHEEIELQTSPRKSADISDEPTEMAKPEEEIVEEVTYTPVCAICQGNIDEDDGKEEVLVRLLPCGHVFHDECISIWLMKKATCPMCSRSYKPAKNPEEEVEGQGTENVVNGDENV